MAEILSGPLELVASGFAYAEDPRRRSGRLYFSDMYGGKVHSVDCLDSGGGIWAACPSGLGVVRFEDGGRMTHVVPMPEPQRAFACMLGGADRRTLFVCTSRTSDRALAPKIRSSRILRLPVDFEGTGLP